MITAVIPTRNRPVDLANAVVSVIKQKKLPDEFLIIDQSPNNDSKDRVMELTKDHPELNLIYIHDTKIAGLVEAKFYATAMAKGDIVAFLEDDVILEPEYIEQIEKGFNDDPQMLGCSGIITNPLKQPPAYNFIFHLFHRGIFRDKRLEVYGEYSGWSHPLVRSDKISGGLSAWRREVFEAVKFDSSNGYFMLEDIDFSTRVAKKFGQRLYINPNARLEHHWSPVNRDGLAVKQQRKIIESFTFYKRRKSWAGATLSMTWLLVGLFFEAIFKSFLAKSAAPVSSYFKGISQGIKKV
jgi:glucosyl-dolichyl phosphate glucuronosyltransferase